MPLRLRTLMAAAALTVAGCASSPDSLTRFVEGDLSQREAPLADLNAAVIAPGQADYVSARAAAAQLYEIYNRRAERQQTFMDIGAAITVGGAAGAFEGGISNSTRAAWAVAAFTPTIISQFNAYEPTRELYHGGALALQLITARYDKIVSAADLALLPSDNVSCTPYISAAATVRSWSSVAAKKAWDQDNSILNEVERLRIACAALSDRITEAETAANYAKALEPWIAARYVNDVRRLDHALAGQDRELRYTPSETLGALISTPLRAADMLLTGTSTKAAIDSIATLNAFKSLNLELAEVSLPTVPSPSVSTPSVSAALQARITATTTPSEVISILRDLDRHHRSLAHKEQALAFRMRLVAEMFEAAGADRLTFSYDVSSRTTTVALMRAVSPAIATATTASAPAPL